MYYNSPGPFLHHINRFSELNESVHQSYENHYLRERIPPRPRWQSFWVSQLLTLADLDGRRDTARANIVELENPS